MKRMFVLLLSIPILFFASLSVVSAESKVQDEIIYNILIDRFNVGDHSFNDQVRVNDPYAYQGGDFLGITNRLAQIEALGFTTIVLSPIVSNATDGYHGYWTEDFYAIEDQFGSMEDFQRLIDEAHRLEMKVVVEFVTNYAAKSHPFVADPTKSSWFVENNVEQTPATEWLEEVVSFNHENDEVTDYLIDVAMYWMEETDIDGFKLHHANLASESFINKFTEAVHEKDSSFYLLANTSSTETNVDYLINNPYIDGIENQALYERLTEVFTEPDVPVSILLEEETNSKDLIFIDDQNTARFSNVLADKGRTALNTWKLALTYMYTTPGIPSIYQGSELPMYGPGFPENQRMMQFNSTDPDLEEFHNRISSIREQFPSLVHGDFEQVGTNDAMGVYKRTYEDETMYIAINNSTESKEVILSNVDEDLQLRGLINDDIVRANNDGEYVINIDRETIEVFMVQDNIGLNWPYISLVVIVLSLFVFMIIYLSIKQRKRNKQQVN